MLPAAALAVWWAHTDLRGDLSAGLLPGRLDQFVVGAAAGALIVVVAARASAPGSSMPSPRRAALPALLVALVAVGTYHGATWRSGDDGILPLLVHPVAGWLLAGVLVRLTCGPTPRLLVHPVAHLAGWRQLQPLPLALPDPPARPSAGALDPAHGPGRARRGGPRRRGGRSGLCGSRPDRAARRPARAATSGTRSIPHRSVDGPATGRLAAPAEAPRRRRSLCASPPGWLPCAARWPGSPTSAPS